MSTPRRTARILAMQMLCQLEVIGDAALDDVEDFMAEQNAPEAARRYARELIAAVRRERDALHRRVNAASPQWSVERMSIVERNIITVAVAEMLGAPQLLETGDTPVPPKVAIDEAIEIGKEYGGADTPRFINGVLDAVYRRIREETGDGVV